IIKDRIKVLLWDGSGFILMYKRVERGSFKWPRNHIEAKQISVQQLEWLLTEISSVRPKNVLSNMSHLLPWSDKVPADCRSNNLEDLRQAETTSED
ncbi:IS66 family insertion sequence element accessory protein TnpB, partial [uncultured Ruminobacter sp.]|uniref:IS66 family insertion sequence element accessory protein TnpB n=1 Tax=uncultured Ruminobacter sp. TaxID=538947 RepID=UPI0025FC49C0